VRVNPANAGADQVSEIDECEHLGVIRASRLRQIVKQRKDLVAPLQMPERQLPRDEKVTPNNAISE
jgi:hypothetical protein